jgi:hypothetical protein
MGRRGYGGLGTKQIVLTIRPSEALASCCGVNLAGGRRRWRVFRGGAQFPYGDDAGMIGRLFPLTHQG